MLGLYCIQPYWTLTLEAANPSETPVNICITYLCFFYHRGHECLLTVSFYQQS